MGGTLNGGAAMGGTLNGGAGGIAGECREDTACPAEEPFCNDGTCGSCKNTTLDCVDGAPRSCVNGSWEPGTPCPDGQSCSEGLCVCDDDDDEPYTTLVQHPLLGCGQKWVDPSEPGYEWIVRISANADTQTGHRGHRFRSGGRSVATLGLGAGL
jgi:hypothetical protein